MHLDVKKENETNCKTFLSYYLLHFSKQGLLSAVIQNRQIFHNSFEAGTHLVWAIIFQHPELLYAAAPVAGNYPSRCLESNSFSGDASRIQLPIKNFTGSKDEDFGVNGRIYSQYLEAKNLSALHGYKNISETVIPGQKPHSATHGGT